MDIKNFLSRLNESQLNEYLSDIMHPEDIETLSDLDTWKEMIDKAFTEYKQAGGELRYQDDFEKYLKKIRQAKYYKSRVKTGADVAHIEQQEKEKEKEKEGPKDEPDKSFIMKNKPSKAETSNGLKSIKIDSIEKGKGSLWKVVYQGDEIEMSADAILNLLMKDQKGEYNEA